MMMIDDYDILHPTFSDAELYLLVSLLHCDAKLVLESDDFRLARLELDMAERLEDMLACRSADEPLVD